MKIFNPNAIYIERDDFEIGKHIEKIGRICYKSEDKITEDSYERFISNLVKNKHYAMLEHGKINIIFSFPIRFVSDIRVPTDLNNFPYMNYTKYFSLFNNENYIRNVYQASIRTFIEYFDNQSDDYILDFNKTLKNIIKMNDLIHETEIFIEASILGELSAIYPYIFEDIKKKYFKDIDSEALIRTIETIESKYDMMTRISDINEFINNIVEEEKSKFHYHSVLFTCDRGVSHELVRHRLASFAQESTRYCNYSNGRFGNEIAVIKPCFWDEGTDNYNNWLESCEKSEEIYFKLIDNGASAQEARSVLPNSLKTDIVVTADEKEWQHIINLRYHGTTGSPHPQMKEVMNIIYPILVEKSDGRIK